MTPARDKRKPLDPYQPAPAHPSKDRPSESQTTVDLSDTRDNAPGALPHERDQQPGGQTPAAKQHKSDEAKKAHQDAVRGRPDTSAAPQLQQPSPKDR